MVQSEISKYITELQRDINMTSGKLESQEKQLQETNKKIAELEQKKKNNDMKKWILQEACKKAREESAFYFSQMCTSGLKTILGDNLEIKIVSGTKNGVPTCDFVVCAKYKDYETETDPSEEDGGGVADIVSLTNFLTMNAINRDNTAPIILDEPTKFVSAGHADNVGKYLASISNEMNKQIIMVTHAKETKLYANKVFDVALDENGTSVVSPENTES